MKPMEYRQVLWQLMTDSVEHHVIMADLIQQVEQINAGVMMMLTQRQNFGMIFMDARQELMTIVSVMPPDTGDLIQPEAKIVTQQLILLVNRMMVQVDLKMNAGDYLTMILL